MYYLDKNIKNLERIFDQNERNGYLRLDLNENPGGLPQEFINTVLKNVTPEFVSQYPETMHFSQVLANFLGVDPMNLCITNGSAEAIRYVIQSFTSQGGRIVGVVPSYFMFQVYSEMYGRDFIGVSYEDDLTIDIEKIKKELTDETQMLILVNPNNPMGNVYSESDFVELLSVCQEKEITILLDEAYHYFYPNTFIKYALSNKRVLVTRTFSKLFSMAGCRLGYVCGCQEDIKYVQKFCTPHNTNAFALLFAEKIITTDGVLDQLINKFIEGRQFLLSELTANGYSYQGDAGNFLFIKTKTDPTLIVERMKREKKILIKAYSNVGKFGTCLRVSIGEKKFMKSFISALIELDK